MSSPQDEYRRVFKSYRMTKPQGLLLLAEGADSADDEESDEVDPDRALATSRRALAPDVESQRDAVAEPPQDGAGMDTGADGTAGTSRPALATVHPVASAAAAPSDEDTPRRSVRKRRPAGHAVFVDGKWQKQLYDLSASSLGGEDELEAEEVEEESTVVDGMTFTTSNVKFSSSPQLQPSKPQPGAGGSKGTGTNRSSRARDEDQQCRPKRARKEYEVTAAERAAYDIATGKEPNPAFTNSHGHLLRICVACKIAQPSELFRASMRFCGGKCAASYSSSFVRGVMQAVVQRTAATSAAGHKPSQSPKPAERKVAVAPRPRSQPRAAAAPRLKAQAQPKPPPAPQPAAPRRAPSATAAAATRAKTSVAASRAKEGTAALAESSPATAWTGAQVAAWVEQIAGCAGCGALFLEQEIDGAALVLLRDTHLFNMLKLKLGPAMKIAAAIQALLEPEPMP